MSAYLDKISYNNGKNQVYAVVSRMNKRSLPVTIAEFIDLQGPGYNASAEADALLDKMLRAQEVATCEASSLGRELYGYPD